MNYTKAAGEKSTVKLTIAFTEEEWQDALTKAYAKTRGKYTVPGFRKGKAPKPVIENYYGKGVFFEEAFNALYSEHYFKILDAEKDNFTAVGEPELSVESMEEGKGVTLSAAVPVKPDVTIEKYTGLKIRKFEYNVTEEDVNKEAKKLAASEMKTAAVERPAQNGDVVNIDFAGKIDGEAFPGGTAEGYDLELGSGSFIPGFEEGLVGLKAGESKDLDINFPEDYHADNLRGKAAVFTVKVNTVTEKQYPDLTDEYVKKHAGCDTVEAYKEKVRARLVREAESRGRDETEGSILAEISKHTTVEIPDAMISNEIDRIVQDFAYRLGAYQGIKFDEYLKYMGVTMEQFRAQYETEAKRRVLCQLIVDKIVKTENFKAEPEEVDAKIAEQAKTVEKTFEEYKKNIDPRQVEFISNDIIVTKLFDFLQANNEMFVGEDKKQ